MDIDKVNIDSDRFQMVFQLYLLEVTIFDKVC